MATINASGATDELSVVDTVALFGLLPLFGADPKTHPRTCRS